MEKFSIIDRTSRLQIAEENEYDLIIIGGGITGAGIALDAASRGMKVILFEKQDFSEGTSSRSTKLVHGGLRYLENLEFGLVRAVGTERRIVHSNAMHIVWPEKMLLPIIKGGTLGKFTTNIALLVYDYLANVKKSERRKMLNKAQTLEKEPLLNSEILKGGALYYEYKTDDSRLTIEIMKKAVEFGAQAYNYCFVENFLYNTDKKINGVQVKDLLSGNTHFIKGKFVVNATGIWVDQLRAIDDPTVNKRLHITRGIHIVVDRKRLPINQSVYFDVGDGRMVFAIPRFNIVYIGTTDTDYNENYEKPTIERNDIEYLLQAANRIFPSVNLTIEDVKSAWAGLRPLIHQEGKKPSELSRKDEIFYSKSGLISIAGGKLTGYRLMAKKIVDIVNKQYKKLYKVNFGSCKTKNIKLSGGEFDFEYSSIKLRECADKLYDKAKETGINVEDFYELFYRYGTNVAKITEKAYEFYNLTHDSFLSWLKAEIWYAVNYECVANLSDFFVRRTGLLFFNIDKINSLKEKAADILAEMLNLSEYQKRSQLEKLDDYIAWATNFKD